MKKVIFYCLGVLALVSSPTSGYAQMPGDKCAVGDGVQIGTTRMANDQQSIIACLKTGNTAPGSNASEWKRMTSPEIPVCTNNQLLMGDATGKLKCMQMSCRIATNQAVSPPPSYVSTATCGGDEFLLNGGAHTHPNTMGPGCPYHRIGYIHTSRPTTDMRGWNVDGFGILEWPSLTYTSVPGALPADTEACTIAYATCCRWVPAN